MQYLANWRLQLAARRIEFQGYSIAQAAAAVGYEFGRRLQPRLQEARRRAARIVAAGPPRRPPSVTGVAHRRRSVARERVASRGARHVVRIMSEHILTLRCENCPGIVAAVASRLAANGGDITEAAQFDDTLTGQFFMRVAFRMDGDRAAFETGFAEEAGRFGLDWTLRAGGATAAGPHSRLDVRPLHDRPALPVAHRRAQHGRGRDRLEPSAEHAREKRVRRYSLPPLPDRPDTKAAQEAQVKAVIEATRAELVVLARYMQVLSDDFSAYLSGRCINIHHSFLPGFKGAKPYHQAHERGVKMIGATAHYVTGDLDEGPIIAQDVEHVSHADTPDDLVGKGRDIERRVLARAVAWHLEDRVLLNGHKTVVFRK